MTTQRLRNIPFVKDLIQTAKVGLARLEYDAVTNPITNTAEKIKERTDLFEAIANANEQDRTSLFHEIGAMAQGIFIDTQMEKGEPLHGAG